MTAGSGRQDETTSNEEDKSAHKSVVELVGADPVNDSIGGISTGEATLVYGSGGTGKSTVVSAGCLGGVVEGGWSICIGSEPPIDRIDMMASNNSMDVEAVLDRILVEDIQSLEHQCAAIKKIEDIAHKVNVITIDTLSEFYRVERVTAPPDERYEMSNSIQSQLLELLGLARRYNIALLVADQVYYDPETDRTRAVSSFMKNFYDTIVHLKESTSNGYRSVVMKDQTESQAERKMERYELTAAGVEYPSNGDLSV